MENSEDDATSLTQKRLAELSKRQRKIHQQSQSYSVFVRRLRLILPLVAIGIVAALMTWPTQERQIAILQEEQKQSLNTVQKNELSNPRFESVDEKNQPYTITANQAIQASDNEELLLLTKPVADMLMNNGSWIAIQSDNGSYWQDIGKLLLENNVRLFHDDGYEMHMARLNVDLNARTAQSDTPIKAHGPAGNLEAMGLTGRNEDGVLIFTGPAKLILKDAGSLNSLNNARPQNG